MKISLNGSWKFKCTTDNAWFDATVPGCNYLDLMRNKIITAQEAAAMIHDGDFLMVGGFMGHGSPDSIIQAMLESGVKDLTVASNDTGVPEGADKHGFRGLSEMIAQHRIKTLYATHELQDNKFIKTTETAKDAPDFFRMGYYLKFSGKALPEMPVAELNVFLRKYLDDNFMLDFISLAKQGIEYSYFNSGENKKKAEPKSRFCFFTL